jgi:general secretion pathway protein J
LPALVAGGSFSGVEFTHAGYPNPAGYLRSNLQRVAYLMDGERLVRRSWRVLDRSQDTLPDEQVLIEGVRGFVLRYLDQQNNWQERWPPSAQAAASAANVQGQWPRAVEVQLSLDDLGVLKWLFRLPDTYQPSATGGGTGAPAPGGGSQVGANNP